MKEQIIDFRQSNYSNVLKKYARMVSRCTYLLYDQYKSVIDINDAYQEVTMCMWNCLKHYDPKKFEFSTYFMCSFFNLKKRFYYMNMTAIEVAKKQIPNEINSSGEFIQVDTRNDSERFVYEDASLKIRPHLTEDSKRVYDVFMKNFKFSPWLIYEELNLKGKDKRVTRQTARGMYKNFRSEVAKLLQK